MQGGWGGSSLTEEESEVLLRSCEDIRKRALLASSANHDARVEKKKRKLAGNKPVNHLTRCGGYSLKSGELAHPYGPSYVMDGHPPMSGPYQLPKDPLNLSEWHDQDPSRRQLEQNAQGNEATASAPAEKQSASEAASERRTSEFARAQAECDAAAKDKQDLLEATMNATTPAALALAYKALDEKKALAALANREKREKPKAEEAANSGEKAPPTSPADERPTMANIEERQAIASIEHYSTANPEAPPTDITDPK